MHNLSTSFDRILWAHAHQLCAAFVLVLTAICTLAATPQWRRADDVFVGPHPKAAFTSGHSWLLVAAIALGAYLAIIPAGESMTWEDAFITFSTFSGHQFYASPIWPSVGRFFPLAHQEFTYLAMISPTLFFYHCFAAFELFVVAVIVFWMLRTKPLVAALICFAFVTTPAISQAYFELIYPERDMLLLLAVALVGAERWRDRASLWGFVVAIFAGSALLLYKETAFLLLECPAGAAVLACFITERSGRNRRMLILALAWTLGFLIWLATYIVAIVPQIVHPYASWFGVTRYGMLLQLIHQPWTWALLVYLVVRGRALIKDRQSFDTIWDGAALSAIVYAAAMVYLRFLSPYYISPAAFLTWILLGRLLLSRHGKILPSLILVLALLQLPATISLIQNQKEIVGSKGQAAAYLADVASIASQPLRVQFPYSADYEVGIFVGLVQAQYNVTVLAGVGTQGNGLPSACSFDSTIECIHGMPEKPGDYIVSFGTPAVLKNATQVFVSQPVGFWHNAYRTYIYHVQNPKAVGQGPNA